MGNEPWLKRYLTEDPQQWCLMAYPWILLYQDTRMAGYASNQKLYSYDEKIFLIKLYGYENNIWDVIT